MVSVTKHNSNVLKICKAKRAVESHYFRMYIRRQRSNFSPGYLRWDDASSCKYNLGDLYMKMFDIIK